MILPRALRLRLKKPLPQTPAELFALTTDVVADCKLPDSASFRLAVAEILLHLDNRKLTISPKEISLLLSRRVANQVAYDTIMMAKELAAKAEREKLELEANKAAETVEPETQG